MANDLKEGAQTPDALRFQEEVVGLADKWIVSRRPPKPEAAAGPGRTRKGG
jgi:hypothetical protein